MPHEVAWITEGKSAICRSILESLPGWFGIPEAIASYVETAEQLPMIGVRRASDVVGFASLRDVDAETTEIVVIGVRPECRNMGIGKVLVTTAERHTLDRGGRLLSVKTLGPSHSDANYRETRAFYLAVGFEPVDESADFWGQGLPALRMMKSLRPD